MKSFKIYICPNCKKSLNKCQKKNHCYFKILNNNILVFTNQKTSKITDYEIKQANIFYKNFLNWFLKLLKQTKKTLEKNFFKISNF